MTLGVRSFVHFAIGARERGWKMARFSFDHPVKGSDFPRETKRASALRCTVLDAKSDAACPWSTRKSQGREKPIARHCTLPVTVPCITHSTPTHCTQHRYSLHFLGFAHSATHTLRITAHCTGHCRVVSACRGPTYGEPWRRPPGAPRRHSRGSPPSYLC